MPVFSANPYTISISWAKLYSEDMLKRSTNPRRVLMNAELDEIVSTIIRNCIFRIFISLVEISMIVRP